MSVQVRRRREAASFLSTYVGAQGELIVDTTNNRVQVHDGATPGGWPAAKLADLVARTAVADAPYAAKTSDRTIAMTALTAPRTISLPAAASFPTSTTLTIVDESGACATIAVAVAAAGTDTINGLAAWPIATAYGYVALESNGAGRWTVIDAPGVARTAIADASYTVLASDRTIAVTSLTAARTISLPAAAAYPTGTQLLVVDESGACSSANAIAIARAGTDTINGASSASIAAAYGYLALESNGVGKWTVVDQPGGSSGGTVAIANGGTGGTSASAARTNLGAAASGANADITSLTGLTSAIGIGGGGTGASTAASALVALGAVGRTAVADANYVAFPSDRTIAVTSLTAARTITLPSTTAYPTGTSLTIVDESGACSATSTLTIARAGTDKINGVASAAIATAYGYLALESNGSGKWTIIDQTPSAVATTPSPLLGYLSGLTLSNDVSNPTTVLDIAAGVATSDDGATGLSLASALTKTLSGFAVGSGNGGLDTGSAAANTWYHVFIIYSPSGPATDVLVSASPTSPTLPSGYTKKRRIGSILTTGTATNITAFVQTGDDFTWVTPVTEANGVAIAASTVTTKAVTVPSGLKVKASLNMGFTAANAGDSLILYTPDASGSPNVTTSLAAPVARLQTAGQIATIGAYIYTDAARNIRLYSYASGNGTYYLGTTGWTDTRGK